MKPSYIRSLVLAALLAALCCIGTLLFPIPLPGSGYANFGDCFVVLSGFVLGPVWGAAAAGLGSMLADVLSGYAYYAPATFVIKALMAVTAALIARALRRRCYAGTVAASVAAECIMVLGYFLYEWALYGIGTAAVDVIGNGLQGLVSIILASVIWCAAIRTHIADRLKP